MHYNKGADLLTYLEDPAVFALRDGYIDILTGKYHALLSAYRY
jgi:galactonate dehydratase